MEGPAHKKNSWNILLSNLNDFAQVSRLKFGIKLQNIHFFRYWTTKGKKKKKKMAKINKTDLTKTNS